jgi:N-acetylglucosamine malate deacetylase 1
MWSPLDQMTRRGQADVLVVVAHPDDEALLCGATVACLAAGGAQVRIACVGSGPPDRVALFAKSCVLLGAEAAAQPPTPMPGCGLVLDRRLVATIDELVRTRVPDVVITHSRSGPQHQDHGAVHDAVRLSMARWQGPALVLAAEPPLSTTGFVPNVFVDVGDHFGEKLDAVAHYRKVVDRSYLDDDYLVHRARWWGQVSGHPGRLCEAYELVVWR